MFFDLKIIRKQFPFFKKNKKIIYFDSASTSLKLQSVVNSVQEYVSNCSLNLNRSFSKKNFILEERIKKIKKKLFQLLNLKETEFEIFFGLNATDVAATIYSIFTKVVFKRIYFPFFEHHSHLYAIKSLIKKKKIKYTILFSEFFKKEFFYQSLLEIKNSCLSFSFISNLGKTIYKDLSFLKLWKKKQNIAILDASQSFIHLIDNNRYNYLLDALFFSAHKYFGLSGLGIGIIKKKYLSLIKKNEIENFLLRSGGGAILSIDKHLKIVFKENFLEAGTLPLEALYSFYESLNFISSITTNIFLKHYKNLKIQVINGIKNITTLKLLFNDVFSLNNSILCLYSKKLHSHDVSDLLSSFNIITRSGQHCASLTFNYLKIKESFRISFSIYNTLKEVDYFINCLQKIFKKVV